MRQIININKDWKFIQQDAGLPCALPEDWTDVDLPHTWNAVDGMDGNGSYDRGRYWYAKLFTTPKQPLPGGRVYVEVLAAGQQATIYVNGKEAAYHEGGYSIFRADVTDLCIDNGSNLLAVSCDNSEKSSVYPQAADFTFYGGLYRGINLISVPDTHFDLDNLGSPGLRVTPTPDAQGGANFEIQTWVTNGDENFTVEYSIKDAHGMELAAVCRPSGDTKAVVYVPDVTLWDCENPYLYQVTASLLRRNEVYDEISTRAGVRSFSCNADEGFILNGVKTPLRGVSRHQDRLYKGNALSREDHYEDARLIKELGANTIRLAHYQHAQEFYDACDEMGFVVWAEIPFISRMNSDPDAHQNCITQMKELIVQNMNHPSICFWGISNEILIGSISQQLIDNHKELNQLCHELDPTRLTTIAHVSMTPVVSPMHELTDVLSYNHYFGWYGGKMQDNGPWLDDFHKLHPNRPLGLSEYGCEGILTYHGPNPAVKDYSEEYHTIYHEHLAKVIDERPWLWSSHVWNMFDFGCAARNEGGVAGRNNKGLITIDRKIKKDAYYVYQAYWSKKPMVHICGRRYSQRKAGNTKIRIYSNQPKVALYLDGRLLEEKTADKVFLFEAAMDVGFHTVVAAAGAVKNSITLEAVTEEPSVYVFPEVNERAEGVANWFKLSGDLDLNAPMEFPDGKYNVHYTLEDLRKCPEAFAIAAEAVKLVMNIDISSPDGMYQMLKSMDFVKVGDWAGSMAPDRFVENVNLKLNKIDVVS